MGFIGRMKDRIVIGRIQLVQRTIEVTAELEGLTSTAWFERVTPAPRLALGYVTELDSSAPRLCLYRAEWSPELRYDLKTALSKVWAEAVESGAIRSRDRNAILIPLGEAQIDRNVIDFVWTSVSGHVQIRFRHLNPNVIGHVVFASRKDPALVANSHHRAWAEEPEHAQSIIRIARGLYHRRYQITGAVDPDA